MTHSISRREFLGRIGAAGAIAGALVPIGVRAQESDDWIDDQDDYFVDPIPRADNPAPRHIRRRGRGWLLRPTGSDDHDNLEWVLRHTAPGATVRLVPATYKFGSPVVIADFNGRLVGAGAARTTITCTDEFSYEVWEAPGGGKEMGQPKPPPFPRAPVDSSTTLTPPTLIQFYKTPLQPGEHPRDRANRIEIRNLRCYGAMIGEPWCFGDEVLCINISNSTYWTNETAPQTTRQDVVVSGVEGDGYRTPEFGPFETGCSCITVLGGAITTSNYDLEGDIDGDGLGFANGGLLGVTPAEGNISFKGCTFRNCRSGPGVVGYRDGDIRWKNNTTDGCRSNCLQMIDIGGSRINVFDNDLDCDSFILPPELAGGASDVPSSLGCVVAFQGMGAALGFPRNVQWALLANDVEAHARHPEAGPVGTWRPQGPDIAPAHSTLRVADNFCRSSVTANTYCVHIIDAANVAFGMPTVKALVRDNGCEGSQTCISLEHVDQARVVRNDCESQAFGIELHNSPSVTPTGNSFHFPPGVDGCEIRELMLGDKIDLSRVVPNVGVCLLQA